MSLFIGFFAYFVTYIIDRFIATTYRQQYLHIHHDLGLLSRSMRCCSSIHDLWSDTDK